MAVIQPFSAEQERALINMRQRYDAWIEAERELAAMPYDLKRKKIGDYAYLYETTDRDGNGKSLGRWSDDKQARFDAYKAAKAAAKARRDGARDTLGESSRIARALRLPMLSADAGPILREADRRSLLGSHLLVIGTNAMAAYALEAAGTFRDVPDETEDFDLAWSAEAAETGTQLWDSRALVANRRRRPICTIGGRADRIKPARRLPRFSYPWRTDRQSAKPRLAGAFVVGFVQLLRDLAPLAGGPFTIFRARDVGEEFFDGRGIRGLHIGLIMV